MHTEDKSPNKKVTFSYIILLLLLALLLIGRMLMLKVNLDYKYFDVGLIIVYSLVTSIHCASMCGGLIITRLIFMDKNKNAKTETIKYIFGRIISYTLMGVVLGAFGGIISISTPLRGVISIIAGVIMLLVALQLFNIIHLPKIKVYPRLRKNSSFLIGLVNVFMPCGSLYIVMLYAITCSNYFYGGLIMLIFALITSISLIVTAFITFKIKCDNPIIKYISFLIIIVLGIQFIFHGLSYIDPDNSNNMNSNHIMNEKVSK